MPGLVAEFTERLWAEHDRHPGDRLRLFSALREAFDVSTVLYPGSFVDIAASFVFDDVTYVDIDRRAARFFSDSDGVRQIIGRHRDDAEDAHWRFLSADYTTHLQFRHAQRRPHV